MKQSTGDNIKELYLIKSLRSNDYIAYHDLYRIFGNDLFDYALSKLGDVETAAQAVEDLFERLWLNHSFKEASPPLYSFFVSELDKNYLQ